MVKLEKQAEIMIADHARKDAPPGSYSWRYIDESIKRGALQDLESHRAGPPVGQIRRVGSSMPGRSGRVPFSAEDDRILLDWVSEGARQGASLKGNKLYEQLEALVSGNILPFELMLTVMQNNRHTAQSWRERWIKQLAPIHPLETLLGRPIDTSQPSPSVTRPGPFATRPRPSATHPVPAATRPDPSVIRPPLQHLVQKPAPPVVQAHKALPQDDVLSQDVLSQDEVHYEEDDLALLEENGDDILRIEPDQEIDAWEAWSAQVSY